MLAYAANAPRSAERNSSPNALLAIIATHVALLAVVMSAKMELPASIVEGPMKIIRVRPIEPPPPPNPLRHPTPKRQPGPTITDSRIDLPAPAPDLSSVPMPPDAGPAPGPTVPFPPLPQPAPRPAPLHVGPQLATPASELKPPYPQAKLLSEEEAVLRLRLTIDEHGRVVAVEPVGRADPVFLAAARRHLLAHWRFRPASDDGRAVNSITTITLKFQLDG